MVKVDLIIAFLVGASVGAVAMWLVMVTRVSVPLPAPLPHRAPEIRSVACQTRKKETYDLDAGPRLADSDLADGKLTGEELKKYDRKKEN